MGIPTLISTTTASGASSAAITSGITSSYDEYMFVITDWNPSSGSNQIMFQTSTDGGSSYGVTVTTTMFLAEHRLNDSSGDDLTYNAGGDIASGTGNITLHYGLNSGSSDNGEGILHLFSPSSTTFVKHFHSRFVALNYAGASASVVERYGAGYFNTTSAIDAIKFVGYVNNFDAVIQMYGIA